MASVSLWAPQPGRPWAALATKPLRGALVVVAVAGMVGGVDGRFDQRQRRYGGPLLAIGPRWSRPPDWETWAPAG